MKPIAFSPENELEAALKDAQEKKVTFDEAMRFFLKSDFVLPTASPVAKDMAELQPIIFDRNGTPMIAVFSSKQRVEAYIEMARYALDLNLRSLLNMLAPDTGIVVNPGFTVGFELLPDGIKKLLHDFPE